MLKAMLKDSSIHLNDERLLPIGKNKKVIGLMDDGSEHKRAKGTKNA